MLITKKYGHLTAQILIASPFLKDSIPTKRKFSFETNWLKLERKVETPTIFVCAKVADPNAWRKLLEEIRIKQVECGVALSEE